MNEAITYFKLSDNKLMRTVFIFNILSDGRIKLSLMYKQGRLTTLHSWCPVYKDGKKLAFNSSDNTDNFYTKESVAQILKEHEENIKDRFREDLDSRLNLFFYLGDFK